MDNLNQLGKRLRKIFADSEFNIRRVSENFPDVHRFVDNVGPTSAYSMEFPTTAHPHTAHLSVHFREIIKPCVIEPPELFVGAEAQCGPFPGSDVTLAPEIHPAFISQIGGFALNPAGGITVPMSGYYNIHFVNSPVGVSVATGSFILAQLRAGGEIIAQQQVVYGAGLQFVGPTFSLWGVGVFLAAGANVSGWMTEANIAFWTPSDFCGLFGGQTLVVTLVGVA